MSKDEHKDILLVIIVSTVFILLGVFITATILETNAYVERYKESEVWEDDISDNNIVMQPIILKPINQQVVYYIPEPVGLVITKEDYDLMATIVFNEAGNQEFLGQVAVAACILNRSEKRNMSIFNVVNEPDQFTTNRNKPNQKAYDAVDTALLNRDLFPRNMFYFRTMNYHDFPNADEYMRIGDHYFSTDRRY